MKPTMRRQGGFSLVELMISIVIGLLALVFAMRLLVSSEQSKQSSVGSSDSMQNGMQALFSMSQDAAQAGWGLNDPMMGGCDTEYNTAVLTMPTMDRSDSPTTAISPLGAVIIKANGDKPDEISLMAGSAVGGTGSVGLSLPSAKGAVQLSVDRVAFAFRKGDAIAIVPENSDGLAIKCSIAQLSSNPAFNSGVQVLNIVSDADTPLNKSSGLNQAYAPNVTRIFNLGPAQDLSFHTWSVKDGFLMLRSSDMQGAAIKAEKVVGNVVSVKAQYGFDTTSIADFTPETGLKVDKWSNIMYDADGDGTTGGQGDYGRIASVRLAVVARSKAPLLPAECAKDPAATVTVFGDKHSAGLAPVPIVLDVSVPNDPVSWTCYRYRVFETIVPIRNLSWRPTA